MTTLVDAPTRVDGVELIGEMVGSGYRTPPALVRRGDGQVLQLTPLLYTVLDAVDGQRTYADIAELVGRGLGRSVTEADVRTLVDRHLRPLGLLALADGTEPEFKRSNPLLALKAKVSVTSPAATRRLTDPFRPLFRPVPVMVILAGFLAVVAWVFFDRGLGASAYDAFQRPHLLLLVFVVTVLSGGFHEFGHAAAARYSGGQPGVMGAGLYLVWPAFYTDVTDSYRLGRAGRIRTDLGGLYFNAIVVVATFVWWWATGWEALLLLVAIQVLQMVKQLLPLLRFDGYHLLADLAGVPDLYHRIKPILLGLLPHRWKSPENKALKPWARALITAWVLVTVPMMALMFWAMLQAVPRLLGSAGSVLGEDTAALADSWSAGSFVDIAGHALQVLGVVLPVVACALIFGRMAVKYIRGLLTWSAGSVPKRAAALAVIAGAVAALAWLWWPNADTYKPIQPGERHLFTTLVPTRLAAQSSDLTAGPDTDSTQASPSKVSYAGRAAQTRLSSGRPLVAAFEKGRPLPTKKDPVLAMVLVPRDEAATSTTSATTPSTLPSPGSTVGAGTAPDDVWVFPFDKPLPPAKGDNQALAVATQDGSVSYDVAFALVWAEGDEVLNINEAHAYASCSNCVAVAVAFQVVLIMDDARVIVPQNLATAANYDCYECITAAIASQLVLSVQTEPGQEQLHALGEVWGRLIEFAGTMTSHSLTEITAKLESFKQEIIDILDAAPIVTPASATATTSPTAPATGTPTPSEQATAPPTEQTGTSPTEQPSTPSPTSTEESTSPPSTQDEAPSTPTPTEEATTPSPTSAEPTSPSPSASPTTSPSATSQGDSSSSPSATATP
jgi:putative peptide zinc metalloprotease protein